jgi:hypothetical protein
METVAANAAAADARLQQLAITEKTLGRFSPAAEDAPEEDPPVVKELKKAEDAAAHWSEVWQEVLDEIETEEARAHASSLARIEEAKQARANAASTAVTVAGSALNSINGFVSAATSLEIEKTEKGSAARRRAMKKAWEAQTAVAIATAALNIPLSIAQAAAGPWPAAIGFMVAAGAASAAAMAGVVAKAAAGPKFHSGGVATAGDAAGFAPDEFAAVLRKGEGVLNPAAVDSMGGPRAIQEMNRGEHSRTSGGPMVVALQVGNRTVDVQQRAALNRPDSPLSSALRKSQPKRLGRHNPWLRG